MNRFCVSYSEALTRAAQARCNAAFQSLKWRSTTLPIMLLPGYMGGQAVIKKFLDTRQQALLLFASKGYSNVGMRELALALGISCGSIYNHIESKEALLYELFEEPLGVLQTKAMQIQRHVEAPKRLCKIIEMHLSLQDRMPHHFQLLEREWRHLNEPWLGYAQAYRARYEQIIATALGASTCSHACTKSIVTLLNQVPAWLPALKLTGNARLDLVHSMVELIIAQAFNESRGTLTRKATAPAS